MGVKNPKYKTPRYSVARTSSQRGSSHWRTNLTEEDVRMMLTLYAEGISQADIARKFDVKRQVVYNIVTGISWAHV